MQHISSSAWLRFEGKAVSIKTRTKIFQHFTQVLFLVVNTIAYSPENLENFLKIFIKHYHLYINHKHITNSPFSFCLKKWSNSLLCFVFNTFWRRIIIAENLEENMLDFTIPFNKLIEEIHKNERYSKVGVLLSQILSIFLIRPTNYCLFHSFSKPRLFP